MFRQLRDWYIAAIGLLLIGGGLYFASQQASDSGAKNTEAKQIANVTSAPEAAKVPNSQSGPSSQKPPNAEATPVINAPSSTAAPALPAESPTVAQNVAPAAHDHSAANTPQTNITQAPAAAPTPAPALQSGSNIGPTPTPIAGGDPAAGKLVFRKCQVCHSLDPGKDILGPSLAGIIGRKSGAEPNYAYSPAMKDANVTWDAKTLDAYLDDPQKFVPGNKMPFPGLKTPQDRSDVIAFIAGPAASAAVQPSSPPAAAPQLPQAQSNAPVVVYIPDAKYTLRSGIAEGRMVYFGVGGAIDGKVNPVLTAAEGQVVQLTLINGEGAEHEYCVSRAGCKIAAGHWERRQHDNRLPCNEVRRLHLFLQRPWPPPGRYGRSVYGDAAAGAANSGRSRHFT